MKIRSGNGSWMELHGSGFTLNEKHTIDLWALKVFYDMDHWWAARIVHTEFDFHVNVESSHIPPNWVFA